MAGRAPPSPPGIPDLTEDEQLFLKLQRHKKRPRGNDWIRERRRIYGRRYYLAHKEELLAKSGVYCEANKDRVRKLKKEYSKKRNWGFKVEALRQYSGGTLECACCGESELKFLTIDHLEKVGRKNRRRGAIYDWLRKNGYPKDLNLQVLCMNCNLAKGAYGECPHMSKSG